MRLHRNLVIAIIKVLDGIFNQNLYADKVIEKVLKQDPDSFGTRINLSVALRKLGRPMEARNYLKDIIDNY